MDLETVQTLLLKVSVFLPLTTGLVQAVKATDYISSRFLPAVAVAIGIGFGLLFVSLSPLGALAGIALGLGAVGLFEFGRTTLAGK